MNQPEPRTIRRDAIHVTGIPLFGNPRDRAFEQAWELFGQIADEVPWMRGKARLYGVQLYPPAYPRPFEFTYLAGVEIAPGIDTPLRCVRKDLPASEYAVFEVRGGPSGIDAAYRHAFTAWLPSSGHKQASPFDFEQYELGGGSESDPSGISIWIPITVARGSHRARPA